ncbi:hypothetical protein JOM56_005282 [Amanita muscaria]
MDFFHPPLVLPLFSRSQSILFIAISIPLWPSSSREATLTGKVCLVAGVCNCAYMIRSLESHINQIFQSPRASSSTSWRIDYTISRLSALSVAITVLYQLARLQLIALQPSRVAGHVLPPFSSIRAKLGQAGGLGTKRLLRSAGDTFSCGSNVEFCRVAPNGYRRLPCTRVQNSYLPVAIRSLGVPPASARLLRTRLKAMPIMETF